MMLSGGSRIKRAPVVRRNRWPIIIIIGVGVLLLLAAGFFAWKYFDSKGSNSDSEASQRVVEKVSKLYITPETEDPTVAQIQDKDKLSGQPFFDKAVNGDYLLIFSDSQIAIIYREDINKIVNVGPISTEGQSDGSPAEMPQEAP